MNKQVSESPQDSCSGSSSDGVTSQNTQRGPLEDKTSTARCSSSFSASSSVSTLMTGFLFDLAAPSAPSLTAGSWCDDNWEIVRDVRTGSNGCVSLCVALMINFSLAQSSTLHFNDPQTPQPLSPPCDFKTSNWANPFQDQPSIMSAGAAALSSWTCRDKWHQLRSWRKTTMIRSFMVFITAKMLCTLENKLFIYKHFLFCGLRVELE